MSQITYKPTPITGNALVRDFEHAQLGTMAEVWEWVVARYGARSVLGTRDVAGEEDEIQCNGTVFKKLILGEYRLATTQHCSGTAYFMYVVVKDLQTDSTQGSCKVI